LGQFHARRLRGGGPLLGEEHLALLERIAKP
jgi:hypothetical protein